MDDKRLIDANELKYIESDANAYSEEWNADYEKGFRDCLDKVMALPTVEAQLVKHGRWIYQGDDMWLCSNCKENIIYSMHKSDRTEKQRYCCRCGARMDGDTNE